jgi:DNA repair protein RecN (Recombination protein N)
VSAEFDTSAAIDAWLDQAGFDATGSLLLRRTVDTQGKSRAWINGSAATATQLRELGEQLLDIHGQHAWQSLTRPEAVRSLLDAYAGLDTAALGRLWQAWRQAQAALAQAQTAQATLQTERERLAWQIGELDKLAPGADEWVELNTEHGRLSNAQALLDATRPRSAAPPPAPTGQDPLQEPQMRNPFDVACIQSDTTAAKPHPPIACGGACPYFAPHPQRTDLPGV